MTRRAPPSGALRALAMRFSPITPQTRKQDGGEPQCFELPASGRSHVQTAPARPLEWNHVEIDTEEADTVFFRLLYSF